MNRIRTFYVALYIVLVVVACAYLCYRFVIASDPLNALAGLLVCLPPLYYFISLRVFRLRTARRWITSYGLPMFSGGFWVVVRLFTGVDMAPGEWIYPGFVFFGWLLYVAWNAPSKAAETA